MTVTTGDWELDRKLDGVYDALHKEGAHPSKIASMLHGVTADHYKQELAQHNNTERGCEKDRLFNALDNKKSNLSEYMGTLKISVASMVGVGGLVTGAINYAPSQPMVYVVGLELGLLLGSVLYFTGRDVHRAKREVKEAQSKLEELAEV